jgi:hypothetical protein
MRDAVVTGGAVASGTSARKSSTAWRKDTPSTFITQSITEPPVWHAPRQCHSFFAGLTTSDGVRSS